MGGGGSKRAENRWTSFVHGPLVWGNIILIPDSPASPFSRSQTLEGLFELTKCPPINPHLTRCIRSGRETRTPTGVAH